MDISIKEDFTHVNLADPMSEERKTLRYSLLYSLEQIYNYNKARNFKDTCIFEIGKHPQRYLFHRVVRAGKYLLLLLPFLQR